ncbi:NAD(P)-dependent oxidoreductase [Deinococcus sp.]|uniref:precorrin-2 dehydrogenase/sirohydrochlorin ferrochelatase family protein n=1 Tax=Deinococcus sp. TaxID=47478 RepID=UPI0025BB1374|nr:NAD(P)-dependent oxidoreductase [Deinococcus sp.]
MTLLPAFLDLHGVRAVVVGGGAVALRRTRALLDAGLRVQVIAPDCCDELAALSTDCLSTDWQPRPYRSGDLSGAVLVVAATSHASVNAQVVRDARDLGLLVNDASDATRGNLRFPAVAARAGVQVAVSTGRELPMLAQALTERARDLLPTPEQLVIWTERREAALTLPEPQRQADLGALRQDIRRAVGVPA